MQNHKGGQRKLSEIRELVFFYARTTGFGVRGDLLLHRACAAIYFVTLDSGCDAMDAGALEEAAPGAFFMNFDTGI